MNGSRSLTHSCFDIVGDVHGCYAELVELLVNLGYSRPSQAGNRHIVFLGDLIDRGPNSVATARLVLSLLDSGAASCLLGNHEAGLVRWLRNPRAHTPAPWLRATLNEFDREDPELLRSFGERMAGLSPILHLVPDRLMAVHAALPDAGTLDDSEEAWSMAVFGAVSRPPPGTRRTRTWVDAYEGEADVVYGHYPSPAVHVVGRTFGIDTGCVYGGALTALRYPELEIISVPAREIYHPAPLFYSQAV